MIRHSNILWKSLSFIALALFVGGLPVRAAPEKNAEKESVSLNRAAFERAKLLIQQGKVVSDQDKAWSASLPSAAEANQFIGKSGWPEYAKWHLGITESLRETTKRRYKFPFGDFTNVYRSALVAAKNRAAQNHDGDIRQAASELLDLIDHSPAPSAAKAVQSPSPSPSPKRRSTPKK